MATFQAPVSGVWSSPNPFSQAPQGSLARGDNVRFTAPGVLGPRPGFPIQDSSSFGTAGDTADQLSFYGDYVVIHYGDDTVAARESIDEENFVAFDGTFETFGANRLRFVGAARDLFFNAADGVRMWDQTILTKLDYEDRITADFVIGEEVEGDSSGATAIIAPGSDTSAAAGTLFLTRLVGVFLDGEDIAGAGGAAAVAVDSEYREPQEPVMAGNPQGLWMAIQSMQSGAGAWMDSNTAVAYRYTICSEDQYGRVIEGPPSGRFVVTNYIHAAIGGMNRSAGQVNVSNQYDTWLSVGEVVALSPGEANFAAGNKTVAAASEAIFSYLEAGSDVSNTVAQDFEITRSVTLRVHFQETATEASFIRLYRSEMTALASAAPSDELWQVWETDFLTLANLSDGYIDIRDTTPEALLEVPLYTNANTGDGSLQANYQPPACLDMTQFASRMWCLNTADRQSLEMALIGIGSPDGLQDNDTITIATASGDLEFTAIETTGTVADDEFLLYTFLDPAANIALTVLSLVSKINLFEQTDVYAFYISAENGLPGKFLIQERGIGGEAFEVSSNRPTAWNPQVSESAPVPSDNNRHPAGLSYSKLGQPEAFPPVNRLVVDVDNDEGLRCVHLNYRLIIFKTSGIYFVNDTAPFSYQKISDAKLMAPDSVAELEDKLYALTDVGFVTVSDSGVARISEPVDDVILPLFGPPIENVRTMTVGVAHRTSHQYICFLPESEDDTTTTHAWVYSTDSKGWTHYLLGATSAAVDPSNEQLLLGATDTNDLLAELRTFTDADYRERAFAVTVSSIAENVLTLADASGVSAGDVILDDADAPWLVSSVDGDEVTMVAGDLAPYFAAGAYEGYSAIPNDVKFNAITGGAPATVKTWKQATILTRRNTLMQMPVSFETEVSPEESQVILINPTWGETPWGETPWGNPSPRIRRIEPLPLADSSACQLQVSIQARQALANFEILGVVVVADKATEANEG